MLPGSLKKMQTKVLNSVLNVAKRRVFDVECPEKLPKTRKNCRFTPKLLGCTYDE